MSDSIKSITGRAIAVRGADIDTDRIVPARFLRCVTFDGLGEHAFEDDRAQARERGETHPFDDPRHAGAGILLVNRNFGCGSSREHAPQALRRWGIKAVVGESYSEIFFGNCLATGVPCVSVGHSEIERLMSACEANPDATLTVDLESEEVTCGDETVAASIPKGARWLLLEGRWDSTSELLDGAPNVEAAAARLPYFSGWRT